MLNAINIAKYVIFRQHAVNKMWHSATDVARSVVCLSVCVGYTHVPGKNCWTDQDAIWVADSGGSRNHVLDWVGILTKRGNFGGCPAHLQALGVSAAVYAGQNGSFNLQ